CNSALFYFHYRKFILHHNYTRNGFIRAVDRSGTVGPMPISGPGFGPGGRSEIAPPPLPANIKSSQHSRRFKTHARES
ncbi:hypothetical protein, partial [Escherichia coli]|uniref:hypothetical protein n=1 Tax=Escherichia coli TaxID=562 RepID=UPI0019542B09